MDAQPYIYQVLAPDALNPFWSDLGYDPDLPPKCRNDKRAREW